MSVSVCPLVCPLHILLFSIPQVLGPHSQAASPLRYRRVRGYKECRQIGVTHPQIKVKPNRFSLFPSSRGIRPSLSSAMQPSLSWHKNHAICYTFNTCTAQWSAKRRTQLTAPATPATQIPIPAHAPPIPPGCSHKSKRKAPKNVKKREEKRWGAKRNGIWNAAAGETIQTNRRPHDSAVTLHPSPPPAWHSPSHPSVVSAVESGALPPHYASALSAGFYLPGFHLAVNATLSRFSTLTTTCCSFNCLLPTAPAPFGPPTATRMRSTCDSKKGLQGWCSNGVRFGDSLPKQGTHLKHNCTKYNLNTTDKLNSKKSLSIQNI